MTGELTEAGRAGLVEPPGRGVEPQQVPGNRALPETVEAGRAAGPGKRRETGDALQNTLCEMNLG